MEGIYIYTKIEIEKLYPGVNRPQLWWDEHPSAVVMVDRLIESIQKEGVRYPLCAVNRHDDGMYEVQTGNQRLAALCKMAAKKAPCIVACKIDQKHIPEGRILKNQGEILSYFGGSAKRICLNPNIFFVIANDNDEWDPDKGE